VLFAPFADRTVALDDDATLVIADFHGMSCDSVVTPFAGD
jgi:hypothetical protein